MRTSCPLSPLLFHIVPEVTVNAVKQRKQLEDWEGKRVAIIFRLLDFIHEKSKRIKAATYTVNLQKLFVFLYICSKPIILKKMIPFTLAYKKEYLKINIMKDFIIFINIM